MATRKKANPKSEKNPRTRPKNTKIPPITGTPEVDMITTSATRLGAMFMALGGMITGFLFFLDKIKLLIAVVGCLVIFYVNTAPVSDNQYVTIERGYPSLGGKYCMVLADKDIPVENGKTVEVLLMKMKEDK